MADSDDEEYENTDCGRQPENRPESGDGPRGPKRGLSEEPTGGPGVLLNPKKIRGVDQGPKVILFL